MSATAIIHRRLSALAPLSAEAKSDIEALGPAIHVPAGRELVADQGVLQPRFLIAGWAARFRDLPDGRRQIIGFVLPGEGIGLCERPGPIATTPVMALTALQYVDAETIADRAFRGDAKDLKNALLIASALDEAWLIDNLVRLGRQTAIEGMAHLFLELRDRLAMVGLVHADGFSLPLTQEQLGDTTGLSAVHVNRTLQNLRADGLIALSGGRLRLLRPEMLEALASYRPARVTGDTKTHGALQQPAASPGDPQGPATWIASHRPRADALKGRRILVVEDEYMIAQDMEHALERFGGEVVGPVASVERALDLLGDGKVDLAVLDVNLGGTPVWPVADALRETGVRFVLATGYEQDALPERYADVPRYEKPVDIDRMIAVLAR